MYLCMGESVQNVLKMWDITYRAEMLLELMLIYLIILNAFLDTRRNVYTLILLENVISDTHQNAKLIYIICIRSLI